MSVKVDDVYKFNGTGYEFTVLYVDTLRDTVVLRWNLDGVIYELDYTDVSEGDVTRISRKPERVKLPVYGYMLIDEPAGADTVVMSADGGQLQISSIEGFVDHIITYGVFNDGVLKLDGLKTAFAVSKDDTGKPLSIMLDTQLKTDTIDTELLRSHVKAFADDFEQPEGLTLRDGNIYVLGDPIKLLKDNIGNATLPLDGKFISYHHLIEQYAKCMGNYLTEVVVTAWFSAFTKAARDKQTTNHVTEIDEVHSTVNE